MYANVYFKAACRKIEHNGVIHYAQKCVITFYQFHGVMRILFY